ncbi:unnamed protein product [Didymodactylos carnosus]|uniref:NAD(P)(+)--arginine ADP-ribosyltransferase n=1 Tax=Didymodactylos carnosus TaxID=1234261 RepID=A0A815AME6_9BILA|nr:unnamed protein product [Didymodactylos carnosus]CAF1318492.1 unnamed protein product [Didymodactylos carnosus]CAF4039778.1 unnamed protein product [Didymodactylos carnosus]CAF4128026.1 unnamed protein product [Didymodactylos carnosus]
MKEMLVKCRDYYKDNEKELEKIDEFEEKYKKEKAVYWYTTPTFVSKLINKALRTEDMHALYICRAYIADLSEQLHKEYEEYKQLLIDYKQPLDQWTVYHGRNMSQEEIVLLRQKIGQLISMNGFLSTSKQKEVADLYAKDVLFIIETTFDLSYGCFAHVAPMSVWPEEDEVLFDLASVFKIKDVKYDETEQKWNVYLVTSDEGTHVLQAHIDSVRQEADELNIDLIFARLLIQIGEYQLANDYLTKLASIIPAEEDNRDLALIYHYHGSSLDRAGNYAQAMVEYEKTLAMQQRLFPEGHSDLGETLGGIGLVYDNMGKYDLSIEKHLQALAMGEKTLPKDHVHIAEALNNVGLCYFKMGKSDLALEYAVRALEMRQRQFPHDHPDCYMLNNIGLAYHYSHEYEKALVNFQQSLEMRQRCLPPDHADIAGSFCNLAAAHLALKHFDEAIDYSLKDLFMSEKTLPPDHSELGITHHYLGQIYRAKYPDGTLALQHYEKAIEIYMKTLPRHHPYIG